MMMPIFAHAVGTAAPHGHAFLAAGTAAVIVGAAALVVLGFRLEDGAATEERRWVPWLRALAVVVGALSLGAAAIHFSVIGVHAAVEPVEGLLFALAAWLQLASGIAVLMWPRAPALTALAVVNAAAAAAWLWSRLLGLPFGADAWVPQSVGPADGLSVIFEALAVALAVACLVGLRRRRRPAVARLSSAITYAGAAVLAVAVATTVVLVGYPPEDHSEPAASAPLR